jgi:hypothetical protein
MEIFKDFVNGAGGYLLAFIGTFFGFLFLVLIILICLKKDKRKAVVGDFVLIINALRGKNKTEP